MPSIYDTWGFNSTPFVTQPLKPDETGLHLLVGRDQEKAKICKRILNYSRVTTVEGQNGIGKTSLINVCSFVLFKSFIDRETKELIIPCKKAFQLNRDIKPEEFKLNVMYEIAQTLINYSKTYDLLPFLKERKQVNGWLNSPFLKSVQASLQAFNFGFSGGNNSTQNTSAGFSGSGFIRIIEQWLEEIFHNDGGVVCIIDNLELLQETTAAKQLLEILRDELLTIQGIRWVLSGSNGIVQGITTSPRLDGILAKPIEIIGLKDEYFEDLIEKRISHYKKNDSEPYLPLSLIEMRHLFDILNSNLRSFFGLVDEFCLFVEENEEFPIEDTAKQLLFNKWLDSYVKNIHDSIVPQLTPRALRVFTDSIIIGGTFSPSDFSMFEFSSSMALRPHVKVLEDLGLFTSIKDDVDQRRKTISVTDKGWLLNYYLEKIIK